MNCPSFIALTPREKAELIGKLIHVVQSDENAFTAAGSMIRSAENNGVFDDVLINPKLDMDDRLVDIACKIESPHIVN